MSTALTLTPINGEPRVYDMRLAERLGFAEPRMIRNLIKRNHDKLLKFGVCYAVEQTAGEQGGRPATEFYLNQRQAIFICMKSETERAFDVQVEIVRVFDAYLNGELKPAVPRPAVPRSFADALQLAADQARQLEAMQPKAEYFDRLMGTHGTVDLETAAKTLRTSRPKLIAFLQDRGILTRKCLPAQTYIDRDYMRVQLTTYEDVYGREQISQKTVITQPGLLYVRGLLDTLERSRALLKSEAA